MLIVLFIEKRRCGSRRLICFLAVAVVLSCLFIQTARASSEMDALLRLLIKKGFITEKEAQEVREELKIEKEATKTEIKVELKEELAEEGVPLSSGGRYKIYGEAEIVGYHQDNVNFIKKQSATFMENYAKIGIMAELTDKVSGDFRIAAANTAGDDSPLYNTSTDDIKTYLDLANLKIKDVMGWPLALTIGRQEIKMGDGFIIGDGRVDTVAQWEIPLTSFDGARATVNQGPFTFDAFITFLDNDWSQWISDSDDQLANVAYTGGGNLYGANLHYEGDKRGIWDFGTFFRDDDSMLHNDTIAISLKGVYDIPFIPNLQADGEVVGELGRTNVQLSNLLTDRAIERRAIGGHLDFTYTFNNIGWTPWLTASYIYLPGDNPDTPSKNESFDPLFFDYTDWGKWYIGNIVGGGGQIVNTNERVAKLELGCTPNSSTQLRLQLFNIVLDRGVDTGFPNKNYANEMNLIFDYWPNEIFYCGAEFGYAHPLEAAKYWMGDDEDIYEFLIWTGVEF